MYTAADMPDIYLAYCQADDRLARQVSATYPHNNIQLLSLVRTAEADSTPLTEALPQNAGAVILLLTRNFLLDHDCVYNLSGVIDRVSHLGIIEEGDPGTGRLDPNRHQSIRSEWQQRYLQLRADSSHYEGQALEDFRDHLDRVREISLALPASLVRLSELTSTPLSRALTDHDALLRLLNEIGFEMPSPATPVGQQLEQREPEEIITHAWSLSDAGDTQEALSLLNRSIAAWPRLADIRFQYALMLALSAQDLDAARAQLNELLDHYPHHHDALFLSGELYEGVGQVAGARVQWDKLSDLRPDYPKLDERLGSLIAGHFDGHEQTAAAHLKRAVKLKGTSAATHVAYARLLRGPLGKPKKARKQLREAIEKDPASATAHYDLAVLEYRAGKLTKARKNYVLATTLEPAYRTPKNDEAFSVGTVAQTDRKGTERTSEPPTRQPMTVLISGATSGIGRATARVLAPRGYRLILLGRRQERLDELAIELRNAHGTQTLCLSLDVRDRQLLHQKIAELPENWREIDILLNNAGKAKGFDPIQSGDVDHWDEMIDVNLKGLLYLTRAVTPGMVDRKFGMVINVASTAGKEVYPNGNVYCATKHAVDALTYAMRLDLVAHGIRVGQICPAHVEETEFAVVRFDGDRERAKIYEGFQPLRSPDVAEAIRFMIEQPRHVNVMDMVLQGTQQASSTVVDRSGREKFAINQ